MIQLQKFYLRYFSELRQEELKSRLVQNHQDGFNQGQMEQPIAGILRSIKDVPTKPESKNRQNFLKLRKILSNLAKYLQPITKHEF